MKLFAFAILALLAISTATMSESEMPDITALNALANMDQLSTTTGTGKSGMFESEMTDIAMLNALPSMDQLSTTTRMGKGCKGVTPILISGCSCYVLQLLLPKIPKGPLKKKAIKQFRRCRKVIRPLTPRRACRKLKFNARKPPGKALVELGNLLKKCF